MGDKSIAACKNGDGLKTILVLSERPHARSCAMYRFRFEPVAITHVISGCDRAHRKRAQGKVRTGNRANIDTCDEITRKNEDTHAKGLKPSLCI